jgi:predicted nucleic acid-binding protein
LITYVDTSALLKLILVEPGADEADLIWDAADVRASSSLVMVEARSALAAARRSGRLSARGLREAKVDLTELLEELTTIDVADALIEAAAELAEAEALRGYDAVHLAAALAIDANVFASADGALCDAAGRRGLTVVNPLRG